MRIGSDLLLALLLALAGGCVLLEDQVPEPEQEERHDLAEFAEQVDDKLRMFDGCRDALASVMHESWERYGEQVEIGGKPTRKREGVYMRGVTDSTFRGCRRLIANAGRMEPELAKIEQITSNLVAAAEQYAAQTRAVERYLDERDDEDDWAGLAEIDPILRAAHQRWLDADHALTDAIDTRHLENDPVLLGVLSGQRSSLELDTRALMVRARPMVRCMTAEPTPSAADCQAAHDEFDAAYTRFVATWAGDRVAADHVFWMRTFAADADEFHVQAGEFQRKLDQRRVREGDVEALLDGHAGLARDFDTLDFDFP
ncbi:DUF3829 domain-containing protein [Nannocystaceae bacterium ST9]